MGCCAAKPERRVPLEAAQPARSSPALLTTGCCAAKPERRVPLEAAQPARSSPALQLAKKGFSVQQLLEFCIEKSLKQNVTTNEVVRDIIIPETAGRATCYMDSDFMRARGGPQRAEKLVSHAWKSRFENTVLNIVLDAWGCSKDFFRSSMKTACELKGIHVDTFWMYHRDEGMKAWATPLLTELQKPENAHVLLKTYWLCIFAVNEHRSICGTCFTCNPKTKDQLAADRCMCSELCTCRHQGTCGKCWTKWGLGKVKFNPCKCGTLKTVPTDPDHEIDKFDGVVELMEGGLVVSLDPYLETLKRVWVVAELGEAMKKTRIQFQTADGLDARCIEMLRLGRPVLPAVKDCEYTSKADYEMILQKIDRNPGGQKSFNDFVWSMIEGNFGACQRLNSVTDSAAHALARLMFLDIDFQWARNFLQQTSGLGVGSAFGKFKQLRELVMNFNDCHLLHDISSLDQALMALTNLQRCDMSFLRCISLKSTTGLRNLGEQRELQRLSMDFDSCEDLTSINELSEALTKLHKLECISLSLRCTRITHQSVRRLVAGIAWLPSLRQCNLAVPFTSKLGGQYEFTSVESLQAALRKHDEDPTLDFDTDAPTDDDLVVLIRNGQSLTPAACSGGNGYARDYHNTPPVPDHLSLQLRCVSTPSLLSWPSSA